MLDRGSITGLEILKEKIEKKYKEIIEDMWKTLVKRRVLKIEEKGFSLIYSLKVHIYNLWTQRRLKNCMNCVRVYYIFVYPIFFVIHKNFQ